MSVETLFALRPVANWADEVGRLAAQPRRRPFEAEAMALVAELSRRVLRSPAAREFSDLAALAHWFRAANLKEIARQVQAIGEGERLRPRGLCFVLAPANVEVLFVYGWLLSLLAGNATIVRVSQKPSAARDAFLGLVRELAAESTHAAAFADSWVVSYPHDDRVTARISALCDARLIWGGDTTVLKIRSIAMKSTAVEGGFADRFSIAALNARAVGSLDDTAVAELARRFVNDTLWSDQQACSSPRCVYWVGDAAEIETARARFWPLYAAAATRFEDSPAAVMSRLTDVFTLAAKGAVSALAAPLASRPARAVGQLPEDCVREIHSGFGLFVEYNIGDLAELGATLHEKDQTLVIHGFGLEEIDRLVDGLPNRALDRIVDVGQATDFAVTWDGTNLFDLLLRRVAVGRPASFQLGAAA